MVIAGLALPGLIVAVWSAIILANKAADRNTPLIERYAQMRVEQRLERAYAHLDDDRQPSGEPSGEEEEER